MLHCGWDFKTTINRRSEEALKKEALVSPTAIPFKGYLKTEDY
jgi:hypothetical protein